MKLIPRYSYEFNCILNEEFSEDEHIKNFASLLSDKDRFLIMLPILEKNMEIIEKELDYKIKNEIEFFVVRAEKFKSFSLPITIEYSLIPEEMILFLLKEIIKSSIRDRFPDEIIREVYVNSFIDYIISKCNFGKYDFKKIIETLHVESKKKFQDYEKKKINFENKTMRNYVEELFLEEMKRRENEKI